MGTEREARALAVSDTIEVNGKSFVLKPVNIGRLCELEAAAFKHFKRTYLETYRDNLDLVGDSADKILRAKLDEVAEWDYGKLPKKIAYDCSRVVLNARLKKWLETQFKSKPETDLGYRALLAVALDTEKIGLAHVKKWTGTVPAQGEVRYDQWWVTASMEGMRLFLLKSLQKSHPEMTEDSLEDWPILKVMEAARLVERITVASMGNG